MIVRNGTVKLPWVTHYTFITKGNFEYIKCKEFSGFRGYFSVKFFYLYEEIEGIIEVNIKDNNIEKWELKFYVKNKIPSSFASIFDLVDKTFLNYKDVKNGSVYMVSSNSEEQEPLFSFSFVVDEFF